MIANISIILDKSPLYFKVASVTWAKIMNLDYIGIFMGQ